jgi:hypothetical protein
MLRHREVPEGLIRILYPSAQSALVHLIFTEVGWMEEVMIAVGFATAFATMLLVAVPVHPLASVAMTE